MKLSDNPAYQVAFTSQVHGIKLYTPRDITKYHTSRYIAAGAQNIFSDAGATKDFLHQMATQVKTWCNDTANKNDTLRSDVSTMMDNLLYRLKYPVDELCSLRMGALFCFMEDENPDVVANFFTERKIMLATGNYEQRISADPELYAFFLNMGIEATPVYKESFDISTATAYFSQRSQVLQSLLPDRLRNV